MLAAGFCWGCTEISGRDRSSRLDLTAGSKEGEQKLAACVLSCRNRNETV
jgi:hypothetical protein